MIPNSNQPQDGKVLVHVDRDLEDLVADFLANRRGDVQSLRAALASGDHETVRKLGHGMKGSGGGFGFDKITEFGAALELAAKQSDRNAIRDCVEKLADYLARVEVVFDEL